MQLSIKKIVGLVFSVLIACIILLTLNFWAISIATKSSIIKDLKAIKRYAHILIPGAGNSPLGEWQNPTFSARMNACVKVYSQQKITRIVCSGVKTRPYYYEPEDMKEFLLKKHIPAQLIILDYGGSNTRQTIYNYASKYQNDRVLIISQRLHLARALFAAKFYGLHAIGYSAGEYKQMGIRFILYEALARMKLSLELVLK